MRALFGADPEDGKSSKKMPKNYVVIPILPSLTMFHIIANDANLCISWKLAD